MGRPLNKHLFGANALNNLKVQFNNGTASVRGYILKQTGSKRFKCEDEQGNVATCYLTAKASADLQPGEMSITVQYDDGTVSQITKITGHRVSLNGISKAWSFSTSTTDGYVQMEEAGDDAAMTNATDLEGDDVHINRDYPVPGSGTFKTAATALAGVNYSAKGTPAAPGGEVSTVTNSVTGLLRTKYDGNFAATSGSLPATWNSSFFATATFIQEIADTSVSWGQQIDGTGLGEHNFSVEWKGYVKVPTTQNYNFFAESDDLIGVWIGSNALSPTMSNYLLASGNKSLPGDAATPGVVNANSVTLDSTKWYPIRIMYSEFNGGCKAQIFAQGADGTKLNGTGLTFAYNSTTKGY